MPNKTITPEAQALNDAIDAAGSQLALADLIGIAAPSLTGWIMRGYVPAGRVLGVERHTGISRHRLRPDIYPPPAGWKPEPYTPKAKE